MLRSESSARQSTLALGSAVPPGLPIKRSLQFAQIARAIACFQSETRLDVSWIWQ